MTHRLANNGCQNDTNRFEPFWTGFGRFEPVLTWLHRVEQNLTTRRAKCHLETPSSLTWSGAERFLVAFYRSFDSIFSKLDRPFSLPDTSIWILGGYRTSGWSPTVGTKETWTPTTTSIIWASIGPLAQWSRFENFKILLEATTTRALIGWNLRLVFGLEIADFYPRMCTCST